MNLLRFLPQTKQNLDSPGVYALINVVTGTIYIGSTTKMHRNRRDHHWTKLRWNNHRNSRLQRSWNKYGHEAFRFEILEVMKPGDDTIAREQIYIDYFFGNNCFNARPLAESNVGWKATPEMLAAMSARSKGRKLPESAKKLISQKAMGVVKHTWSEESRRKVSEAKAGKPRPPHVAEMLAKYSRERMQDPEKRNRLADMGRNPEVLAKSIAATQKTCPGTFLAPDGRTFTKVTNISKFSREHDLRSCSVSNLVNGHLQTHKGWRYFPPGTDVSSS